MMDATDPSLQHLPVQLRNLQPSLNALHPQHATLASHLGPDFDPSDPHGFQSFHPGISDVAGGSVNGHHLQSANAFEQQPQHRPRLHSSQTNGHPRTPTRQTANENTYNGHSGSSFGLLSANHQLPSQPLHNSINRLQKEDSFFESPEQNGTKNEGGHFNGMKLIDNPPDLEKWRERLFNVDGTITLTEEEFQTYFPHVDNIYSHRSTQKYKRKPFISHYWDCRLKGRPPGTPKSDDPNKKKRKRTARQRDLCDVKIKITEYFPGAAMNADIGLGAGVDPLPVDLAAANFFAPSQANGASGRAEPQPFGVLAPSSNLPIGHPGASGAKYYTIQRVNGNGGNGKTDGVEGPHKHTLEESDRVKKNSVQRWLMKEAKEKKKNESTQKTYHKRATGQAQATVKRHSREADLKLFGSCFCPFVQRVWIALEVKGIPYQYIEVDPYKKPESLLEVNPRGLVPAIRHGNWGCYESTVLMEYLEDLSIGHSLLPLGDPQLRAHCRLWADHVSRHITPTFYRLLQSQDPSQHLPLTNELQNHITSIVNASHVSGPFFLGSQISFVDISFAPWMLRLSRVLKPYRGWPDPEVGSRWEAWIQAIENDERVKNTTSSDELYLESYERYADNRPGTSKLQEAIDNGWALP